MSINPGTVFRTDVAKFTVTSVEAGRVRFSQERPDGTVTKGSLPLGTFKKMVASHAQDGQPPSELSAEVPRDFPPLTQRDPPGKVAEEFSAEDIAEFERLESLYEKLSETDRYYIVSRWDEQQHLEPTHQRVNYRNLAPLRARRRQFWSIVALVLAAFFVLWIGRLIEADHQRQEESFVLDLLRERSQRDPALKSAVEAADREYQELIESQRPEPDER